MPKIKTCRADRGREGQPSSHEGQPCRLTGRESHPDQKGPQGYRSHADDSGPERNCKSVITHGKKSQKRKRNLRKSTVVDATNVKSMKKALPYL